MNMQKDGDVFGEVIYSYTRKEAIADGVLIDVSDQYNPILALDAGPCGEKLKIAEVKDWCVTQGLFNWLMYRAGSEFGDTPGGSKTLEGLLVELLGELIDAQAKLKKPDNMLAWKSRLGGEEQTIWAICSAEGEGGSPAITIMFPEDY